MLSITSLLYEEKRQQRALLLQRNPSFLVLTSCLIILDNEVLRKKTGISVLHSCIAASAPLLQQSFLYIMKSWQQNITFKGIFAPGFQ